ncbi:ankyrin repeat protein [Seminavis robusta]|uniref:Ankyrin repeat protein n=1 Tax=Seminavis robusta TaxID=568900 RepID=A0A9N8EQM2_9STRA|nr:ankyrin repeat protein [Seminavis robusta]|eukprot:Sro1796_g298130.1 ankyrin repeat protein (218) ;mRNA; f:21175-21828
MSSASGAKEEKRRPDILLLLDQTDLWVTGILPFVGSGHFAFVAAVCHRFKDLYQAYWAALKEDMIEKVRDPKFGDRLRTRRATSTDTFYSAVFTSLSCTKYWNADNRKEHNKRNSSILRVATLAAKSGNLAVFQWVRENGWSWDTRTCYIAAGHGHFHILKYAHENGCDWDSMTCYAAAEGGHLDILKYARENYCPWHSETCAAAAANGPWIYSNGS